MYFEVGAGASSWGRYEMDELSDRSERGICDGLYVAKVLWCCLEVK